MEYGQETRSSRRQSTRNRMRPGFQSYDSFTPGNIYDWDIRSVDNLYPSHHPAPQYQLKSPGAPFSSTILQQERPTPASLPRVHHLPPGFVPQHFHGVPPAPPLQSVEPGRLRGRSRSPVVHRSDHSRSRSPARRYFDYDSSRPHRYSSQCRLHYCPCRCHSRRARSRPRTRSHFRRYSAHFGPEDSASSQSSSPSPTDRFGTRHRHHRRRSSATSPADAGSRYGSNYPPPLSRPTAPDSYPPTRQTEKPPFMTYTLPHQVYLLFLFRLPALYSSRVARIFQEAGLEVEEIEEMAAQASVEENKNFQYSMLDKGYLPETTFLSPPFMRFRVAWEFLVDKLVREWETLNIVSVLLLPAIVTIFQIKGATEDPVTRYTAFWSLICALLSLLYGCLFIIRFGSMRKASGAAKWAKQARRLRTAILWNVWVMLAMPAVWMCWSILTFIVCIMSFMWRASVKLPSDYEFPAAPSTEFGYRIFISIVLSIGVVYGILINITLSHYDTSIDQYLNHLVQNLVASLGFGSTYSPVKYPPYPSTPNHGALGTSETVVIIPPTTVSPIPGNLNEDSGTNTIRPICPTDLPRVRPSSEYSLSWRTGPYPSLQSQHPSRPWNSYSTQPPRIPGSRPPPWVRRYEYTPRPHSRSPYRSRSRSRSLSPYHSRSRSRSPSRLQVRIVDNQDGGGPLHHSSNVHGESSAHFSPSRLRRDDSVSHSPMPMRELEEGRGRSRRSNRRQRDRPPSPEDSRPYERLRRDASERTRVATELPHRIDGIRSRASRW